MSWVVDTCLLIDVAEADACFGAASAELIDSKRLEGLTICPVSYVELAPVFNGDAAAQNQFLFHLGAAWPEEWTAADTLAAHEAWGRYVITFSNLMTCKTIHSWFESPRSLHFS
jgi:hypothetical protein